MIEKKCWLSKQKCYIVQKSLNIVSLWNLCSRFVPDAMYICYYCTFAYRGGKLIQHEVISSLLSYSHGSILQMSRAFPKLIHWKGQTQPFRTNYHIILLFSQSRLTTTKITTKPRHKISGLWRLCKVMTLHWRGYNVLPSWACWERFGICPVEFRFFRIKQR